MVARALALSVLLCGCRVMSIALDDRPCDAQSNCLSGYFCDLAANQCLADSERRPLVNDLAVSNGESDKVVLSFTMPDGADECVVMRKTVVYPSSHDDATATQVGDVTGSGFQTVTDSNVMNGTTYYYLVVCRAGSAWADTLNADPEGGNAASGTPSDPAPLNPTDVMASDGQTGRSTITFTMPPPPVSDCSVRRRSDDYPDAHDDGTAVGPPVAGTGAQTVIDTGLVTGSYFYAVFCRNGSTYNDALVTSEPGANADTADVL